MRSLLAFLFLALGCSCPDVADVPDVLGSPDAALDARAPDVITDVGQDAPSPVDSGPTTPVCIGETVMNESGALSGTAFGQDFSFPFIVGGIEQPGGLSCPRVFIRAGATDNFSGFEFSRPYFELEIPISSPGLTAGTITWFFADGGVETEEVMVNVTRADGLFETELPASERRIEFSLSHHDATTDFDAEARVATYCNNFSICI